MEAADLARAGHLNLGELCRRSAQWGEGGRCHQADGVLLFATGSWVPVEVNGAFRADRADAGALVAAADEFFTGLGRGWSIRVRDSGEDDDLRAACVAAGLARFGQSPEMACVEVPPQDVPDGIVLDVVSDADGMACFVGVVAAAYRSLGMPAGQVEAVFGRPSVPVADPDLVHVIARLDGRPVGAAQGLVAGGVGGIYWVGTTEDARGRGVGGCCTAWVARHLLSRGVPAVTLQASPMGEPVYRRLGFDTLYRYETWVRLAG